MDNEKRLNEYVDKEYADIMRRIGADSIVSASDYLPDYINLEGLGGTKV